MGVHYKHNGGDTEERLCQSVFRHWLLIAQVWTQNMNLYGICGKMSFGQALFYPTVIPRHKCFL
jgi:hypothetical protein